MSTNVHCQCIDTKEGRAYVIDSALDENTLRWIDEFRLSLPLDSKRPTVDRRFFADGPPGPSYPTDTSPPLHAHRPMSHILETAIRRTLAETCQDGDESSDSNQPQLDCHVFRYQRFLEYTRLGSKLDPHTDGTKICDDTKRTSTHTLLLYLTDCEVGGETILMSECSKEIPIPPNDNGNNNNKYTNVPLVLYPTQPRRGRILLFPHLTPHAGAGVVSPPKICLRAEVCIFAKTNHAPSQNS